jgi:hypothetical protein
MLEKAMNPGHADVKQMLDAIPHQASGEQSFFSYGNVARACGHDQDRSLPGDFFGSLDSNGAG